MEFENSFSVAASVDELWIALLDMERVVPCVPGATILEVVSDSACRAAIKLRVGPVSMMYTGDVEIAERDDAAKLAVLNTNARETKGQGGAQARVSMALTPDGHGSSAALTTDVRLSGKAASMGHSVIADVSGKLIQQFAANLEAMLAAPAPGAA